MKRFRQWIPAVMWMVVIFLLSSRPSAQVSPEQLYNFIFFKTLHVVEYGILFILIRRGAKDLRLSFVLTLLYALTDEFHQLYVPSREGRLRDVIIDGLGALIAWLLLVNILPNLPPKLRRWVSG